MTKAFKEAVLTGRAILKEKWQDSNVSSDRSFGMTEIRCPGCGVVISKLLPIGAQKITRMKGRTIIQESVGMARLSNYREVAMLMTDGSRHVTNACQDCAAAASDPMFATALYVANLSQFSSEGAVLSDEMCNRGPVSVLNVDTQIRD